MGCLQTMKTFMKKKTKKVIEAVTVLGLEYSERVNIGRFVPTEVRPGRAPSTRGGSQEVVGEPQEIETPHTTPYAPQVDYKGIIADKDATIAHLSDTVEV